MWTEHWDFPGVLLKDGRVLLAGGAGNYLGSYYAVTPNAELFNPASRTFTPTIPMNSPRRNHTATRLADGRVLIAGGFNSTPSGDLILASAEIFDPASAKTPALLSIEDATILEGDTGTNLIVFKVNLSLRMGVAVSVDFTTGPGTAETGADFQPASGTLVFAPGTTNQQITVPVLGDRTFEPDESFGVALANPTNAILFRAQATGTILNDDPFPTVSV